MNKLFDITTLMLFSETWQKEAEFTWNMYCWSCIIGDSISIVFCLVVLIIISCVRKRTEVTLTLIPALLLVSNIVDMVRVIIKQNPYFDWVVAFD